MRSVFILLTMLGLSIFSLAQVTAKGLAVAGDGVEATIGVFTFSPGDKVAFELVREEPCPCMCGDLLVRSFRILAEGGAEVFRDAARPYPVEAAEWVGRWDLADPSGTPAPPGRYIAVVETSVGTFRAELEVDPGRVTLPAGRSLARASVCGISLRVYRLVTADENGAEVALCRGEGLMVALPGNPTTGYGWAPIEEPGFLARLEGVEYLPATALVGGGGTFFFRYEAREEGVGVLAFAYLRPWEEESAGSFSVTVRVY
ncbi:protease inhibitor I42 family protein [Candidatus Bipolaricaulota sp. J31]